ncbi:MAG: quinone-dependent dihydroorotate dehydrogenase [Planctomycetes bacterium]|nr:quinone-dependent dihydroorotate dehydrogenase [Planctomycetota bacterium]
MFSFQPETAHALALKALHGGLSSPALQRLVRSQLRVKHAALEQRLFAHQFLNPIGLAAGFDKNARSIDELAAMGFSHIEAGTVTALAQAGNPMPRSFRLPQDQSLINRMGFNNDGCRAVAARLAARYDQASGQKRPPCILGINIGKSKLAAADKVIEDHLQSVEALSPYADYMVVNVSCPNVEGVTALQSVNTLEPLLSAVRKRLFELAPDCRMLVKISPDLNDQHLNAVLDVILSVGANGIIATNTSTRRSGLQTSDERIQMIGKGGLSGSAIRQQSTEVLAHIARYIDGRLPIIGVGGIDSPQVAWEKICAGASLLQVYTGFIYAGPLLVRDCNRYFLHQLQRLGLRHIREAVGRDL